MKKIIFLLLAVMMFAAAAQAQYSPFKPIRHYFAYKPKAIFGSTATDSTFGAWRFVTSVVGYTVPDKLLMAGAGFGFNVIKYNYASQTAKTLFSINAMMWATGSTAPTNPSTATTFGADIGLLNQIVQIGWGYNQGTKRGQLIMSVGVPLN